MGLELLNPTPGRCSPSNWCRNCGGLGKLFLLSEWERGPWVEMIRDSVCEGSGFHNPEIIALPKGLFSPFFDSLVRGSARLSHGVWLEGHSIAGEIQSGAC